MVTGNLRIAPDTLVRTVPAHDELHRDEGAIVLVDGRAQLVSVIGVLVREAALDGATVADVAAYLEDVVGAPPEGDALTLTTAAVRTLADVGLLTVED